MPRSPFSGTFQPNLRPTVVQGPDALVYINGETDVVGCASCKRKFDFNSYITSISVDLQVESSPGSASINLSIPRHAIDEFYFEGNPLITPMMEIEIFAKGYFLVEGVPQYYPIFWGLVTEVGDAYSSGEQTITIQCADILKWWELCKMNINPALTAASGQGGRSIFGNVFFGMNPYDVIWTCAQQSFGDVVVGSGSLVSLVKEQGESKQVTQEALRDIMAYWSDRFSRTRSNLLLYGTNGVAVRGDTLYDSYNRKKKGEFLKPFASSAVRNANGGSEAGQMVFDPTDPAVVAFRTQFSQAGAVNFWTSEYQTKLELANAAKEAIGFEFFMDVTGDLVFKPPFYNLDVLSNKPLSWIQDIDIIDWNFSESEAEVVTQLTIQGSFGGNVDYGFSEECTPFTSVTDYHLLRKYGWRSHTFNSEFMGDPQLMFYHGLDMLDRINSKRHRGTVTIPMRAELRLGFPVYIAPRDEVWYVAGISHSISFGGRAQTTLTLTARRQKFFAPRGIGSMRLKKYSGPGKFTNANSNQKAVPVPDAASPFKYSSKQISKYAKIELKVGDAAQLPATISRFNAAGKDNPYLPLVLRHPKTGRAVGFPNAVMVYTRPFAPPRDDLAKAVGQKTKSNPQVSKKKAEDALKRELAQLVDGTAKQNTSSEVDKLRDVLLNNRYQYGLTSAGVFVYAHDKDRLIGEVSFVPSANITTVSDQSAQPGTPTPQPKQTAMIRPVSDERGMEVIGHFRYGRGLSLRDGSLIYTPNQQNRQASVGLQVALAGDLFSSLAAQSQGLTSVTSANINPIDAITHLQPEDMQAAGVYNPETHKAEYVPAAKNYMDTAPLGSAEQAGQMTVEASQLSRALTIAELNVLKDPGSQDTQCACITGRSDLAFINVGYQIKPLYANTMGGAAPDNSLLPGNSVIEQAIRDGVPVTDEQYQAAMGDNALDRIDEFLYNLYSALDAPHQELEATLRGEKLDITLKTATQLHEETGTTETSALSPPFNPANRLGLGDPAAIAAQASSAEASLTKSWNDFGSNLKKNTEKAKLQGDLNLAKKELAENTAEIARLQKLQSNVDSGSAHVVAGDIQKQIADLQAESAKLQQQIANTQAQLNQLGA